MQHGKTTVVVGPARQLTANEWVSLFQMTRFRRQFFNSAARATAIIA